MLESFWDFFFPFLGGILLSISTSLHLLLKGRVTGMSGIYHGIITCDSPNLGWRVTLICAMMMTGSIGWLIQSYALSSWYLFDSPQKVVADLNLGGFFLAGLLVGFGTKLSNGCTSGHGVCGLPRFSIRSWVAVPVFLLFGIGMATLRRHVPFLNTYEAQYVIDNIDFNLSYLIFFIVSIILIVGMIIRECAMAKETHDEPEVANKKCVQKQLDILISFAVGALFAAGLLIGGMAKRSKIINFLAIDSAWDISLLFVLLGAVAFNIPTFWWIFKREKPILESKFNVANSKVIDWKLILGAAIFGIGWGLGGLCPGPGFVIFPMVTPHVTLLWFAGLSVGQYLSKFLEQATNKEESGRNLVSKKTFH